MVYFLHMEIIFPHSAIAAGTMIPDLGAMSAISITILEH